MNVAGRWCMFGVCMILGITMVMFGLVFMRTVFITLMRSEGEIAFSSLVLGAILLIVGGGLVSSSIKRYVRKTCAR